MGDEERREDPPRRTGLCGVEAARSAGLAWKGDATAPAPRSRRSSASASPCGEAQSVAASRSASYSRFGERTRCSNDAASGARKKSRERALEGAPDARGLDDGRREDDRPRLKEDVTEPDMSELVRDDAFELGGRRDCEQPRRDRDRGATLRAASGAERAREAVLDQIEPGLDDAGADREPVDRRSRRARAPRAARAARAHRPCPSRSGLRTSRRPQRAGPPSRRRGARAGSRRRASRAALRRARADRAGARS